MANISAANTPEETIAQTFRVLTQPIRIQILLILERQDACVCHLEAWLGVRQALISQHLMILRDAGIVSFYREGRNIYYQLARPGLLPAVRQVGAVLGIPARQWMAASHPAVACPCPHCNPGAQPDRNCSNFSVMP